VVLEQVADDRALRSFDLVHAADRPVVRRFLQELRTL
jgi:hypothetical protein